MEELASKESSPFRLVVYNEIICFLKGNYYRFQSHLGFLAELFLPVLFMALLILIKSITNVYDSPNVAYFCGNTYPWYYASSIDTSQNLLLEPPFTCSQKPSVCTTSNYYQNGYTYNDGVNDITSYSQYGKIRCSSTQYHFQG